MNNESKELPPLDVGSSLLNVRSSERFELLDNGYIELVESWGSDEMIVECARMSTAKGFLGWGPKHRPECASRQMYGYKDDDGKFVYEKPCDCKAESGDEKLLRYLWEHKHSTPFEFAGMTIEVQAPLFVFREWHRHRTQSYSERSARYTPLPDFNYVPTPERLLEGGGHLTKQAASVDGARVLDYESALEWLADLDRVYQFAERVYQEGLQRGVPKEIARLSMTVGRYSVMRASTDLRNWLAFCTLRMPSNAQQEIRVYAEAVHAMLSRRFPRTLALFDEGMK